MADPDGLIEDVLWDVGGGKRPAHKSRQETPPELRFHSSNLESPCASLSVDAALAGFDKRGGKLSPLNSLRSLPRGVTSGTRRSVGFAARPEVHCVLSTLSADLGEQDS